MGAFLCWLNGCSMYGVKELGIPSVAAFRQNEQADLVEMGWGKKWQLMLMHLDIHASGFLR